MPVRIEPAIAVPVLSRFGIRVAVHLAPQIRPEAAVKVGFGVPPRLTS